MRMCETRICEMRIGERRGHQSDSALITLHNILDSNNKNNLPKVWKELFERNLCGIIKVTELYAQWIILFYAHAGSSRFKKKRSWIDNNCK